MDETTVEIDPLAAVAAGLVLAGHRRIEDHGDGTRREITLRVDPATGDPVGVEAQTYASGGSVGTPYVVQVPVYTRLPAPGGVR